MKIGKSNLIIYIIAGIVSLICIGLFFIDKNNAWCIVSCSIGASGIGAVLLSVTIELSNNNKQEKTIQNDRKIILYPVILSLRDTICNFIKFLIELDNPIRSKTIKEFLAEFETNRKDLVLKHEKDLFIDENDLAKIYGKDLKKLKNIFSLTPLAREAIDELIGNRSFIIRNQICTNDEILYLNMDELILNNIATADNILEIDIFIRNLLSYINLPEILSVEISYVRNELTFLYEGKSLFIEKIR